jgi:hypothetical protein
MLLDNIASILKQFMRSPRGGSRQVADEQPVVALQSIGFDDFLAINMPPREYCLLAALIPAGERWRWISLSKFGLLASTHHGSAATIFRAAANPSNKTLTRSCARRVPRSVLNVAISWFVATAWRSAVPIPATGSAGGAKKVAKQSAKRRHSAGPRKHK